MSDKKKFPFEAALRIARDIKAALEPYCSRIQIVGSLRRRRREVGDVELLFIGTIGYRAADLFDSTPYNCALKRIDDLVKDGLLTRRQTVSGTEVWGDKNRLAVHAHTGIPVDLFRTTDACWWNALVVRTGGKENNIMIAKRALERGWRFEAYGDGFTKLDGSGHHQTTSEEDVFRFVGIERCPPPHLRK